MSTQFWLSRLFICIVLGIVTIILGAAEIISSRHDNEIAVIIADNINTIVITVFLMSVIWLKRKIFIK